MTDELLQTYITYFLRDRELLTLCNAFYFSTRSVFIAVTLQYKIEDEL